MLIAIWQSNSKFVSNLQVREVIMFVSFGVVDGFRSQESNLMFWPGYIASLYLGVRVLNLWSVHGSRSAPMVLLVVH